jgi:hypothetical protein
VCAPVSRHTFFDLRGHAFVRARDSPLPVSDNSVVVPMVGLTRVMREKLVPPNSFRQACSPLVSSLAALEPAPSALYTITAVA